MLPLRDENPTQRLAIVTVAIIALNVVAFLVWEPTLPPRNTAENQAEFFFCNAEVPWEVTHQENLADGGADARDAIAEDFDASPEAAARQQEELRQACPNKSWLLSIFTAMFLHGGWLHIGGNMLFLWIFGNNVEDRLGPVTYILFYLAAGIAAAALQLVTDLDSAVPNLGASGAIAGVLGAYIVMFPRRRVLTLVMFFFITFVYLPAFVVLGLWFVLQLFSGVGSLTVPGGASGGGVAFFAHVGGFVFGALVALLFFPKEGFGARPPPPRPDVWGRRRAFGWGQRGGGGWPY